MTDDLDELERRVKDGRTRLEQSGYKKPDAGFAYATVGEVLSLIERCRKAEADIRHNLQVAECIVDDKHALEWKQVRDENESLRARLARWPEAVEKVRDAKDYPCTVRWIFDEIVQEATEKRDAPAPEAGKE